MSENNLALDSVELREWRAKIELANRHNIFCHCRACHSEWVDSSWQATCSYCGSQNVERISCWQFPDD